MDHLFKYLYSARHDGIRYSRQPEGDPRLPKAIISNWNKSRSTEFQAYSDSDFAGCPDSSRSTSGGVLLWMGAAISWMSVMQVCVTLSSAEAEMVAMTKMAQETIWF